MMWRYALAAACGGIFAVVALVAWLARYFSRDNLM